MKPNPKNFQSYFAAAALMLGAQRAPAATINAASCSRTDVIASINATAPFGDTVVLPNCDATWTSPINFSTDITNGSDKALTIQGQVTGCPAACTSATTIRDGRPNGGGGLIHWVTVDTGLTRITGINFVLASNGSFGNAAILFFNGVSSRLRIDHNRFDTVSLAPGYFAGVWVDGYNRGVFDHNYCINGTNHCIGVFHSRWNGTGGSIYNGDASFAAPDDFGTAQAFFLEDNIFNSPTYPYPLDTYLGSRIVVRKNHAYQGGIISDHGTETAGRGRSIRWKEVYNNTIHWDGIWGGVVAGYRGGTGPTFNNTLDLTNGAGTISGFASFIYNRNGPSLFDPSIIDTSWAPWGKPEAMQVTSLTQSGGVCTATVGYNASRTLLGHGFQINPASWLNQYATIGGALPSGYNVAGVLVTAVPDSTHFSYSCSAALSSPATGTISLLGNFDNYNDPNGLLALDQPGAGQSDLMSNPSCSGFDINGYALCGVVDQFNVTQGNHTSLRQQRSPIYVWGNYKTTNGTNPVKMGTQVDTPGSARLIKVNGTPPSNVYDDTPIFDGKQGVGVGTLASRPAVCTQGVGFWRTDEGSWDTTKPAGTSGVLYICGASSWPSTPSYTPFTYPHPLVTGSAVAAATPPARPRGLALR